MHRSPILGLVCHEKIFVELQSLFDETKPSLKLHFKQIKHNFQQSESLNTLTLNFWQWLTKFKNKGLTIHDFYLRPPKIWSEWKSSLWETKAKSRSSVNKLILPGQGWFFSLHLHTQNFIEFFKKKSRENKMKL